MRKIGGHVSTAGGIINAVQNTLDIGGNCMQIFAGSPRMWKRSLYEQEEASNFIESVKSHSLFPVYIHALYLTNLASDKEDLRQKSRQALIMDMKNSSRIQSAGVILHIGSHQGRGFEEVKDTVVSEIKQVLDNTPEDSILILENSAGQKGKIGSFQEISAIIQEIDTSRLKVCLDSAHAFEAGYALNSKQGLDMFINDINKTFGFGRLSLLHINDSRTRLGSGHDQHANLGEGYIGKEGLSNLINHAQLKDLPLILEVPGFDQKGPDKKNIDILKSLVK